MPRRLRIATWNINSIRLRAPLLRELVSALEPDVVCLQETKCPDEHFPHEAVAAAGFAHVAAKGMKGYNGVAILSRIPFQLRETEPDWCERGDCRHLGVTLDAPGGPVELHNFYVPAGGDVADPAANPKFAHKLNFVAEVTAWGEARAAAPRRILVGDLNIAPLECDVWNHKQLLDVVSHTPVETEAMARWMARGAWRDAVRHLVPPPERLYSWWSYRARDWAASDRGRRLDHIWTSDDLLGALSAHRTHRAARDWPQASDHVPVMLEWRL
jgi:exodeoxyribonuclease-3